MSTGRVNVAIRVRPVLNSGGSAAHQQEKFQLMAVKKLGDGGIIVEEQKPGTVCRSQQFTFDNVFDGETGQLELYEEAVVDMIDGALIGHDATVLAYGQTGSGKTHTILGDVKPNPLEDDLLTANSGVFLRVLSDLLDYRQRKAKDTHVVIGLSCIEIYNENLRDLFGGKISEDPPPLKISMVGETVLMPGLTTTEVTSMMSVFNEIQLAIGRRQSRATEANSTSSRSHCLFLIDILQQSKRGGAPPKLEVIQQHLQKTVTAGGKNSSAGTSDEFAGTIIKSSSSKEPIKFSRILIADLAGSEKTSKSGVTGEGLKEANSINLSLTALGNVVHSLYQGASHVKYRDSNLTRLLMPSFSQDTSRVLLLAHCSPTQLTYDESVSTLHFANKVKAVKVQSSMNEIDNTIPEYLETVRNHDTYTADLRIWRAETQGSPLLTKNGMSLLSNRFRSINLGSVPGEAARLSELDKIGALRNAHGQVAEIEAAERKEQEELKARLPTMVDSYVSSFRARCNAARDAIAKYRGQGLPFMVEACEDNYLAMVEEAEADFQTLLIAESQGVFDLFKVRDGSVSLDLAKARAVVLPKVKMDDAYVQRVEQEDEQYALSSAAHCNGRRFLNAFLEMRDTHSALLVCLSNKLAGLTWQAKQPKPKKTEEEQEAADVV